MRVTQHSNVSLKPNCIDVCVLLVRTNNTAPKFSNSVVTACLWVVFATFDTCPAWVTLLQKPKCSYEEMGIPCKGSIGLLSKKVVRIQNEPQALTDK